MSSPKPFTVQSYGSGVPPPTPVSNTQTAAQTAQYQIRPDKQFFAHKSVQAGNSSIIITSKQNLMITKIFYSCKFSSFAYRFLRVFTWFTDTQATTDFYWTLDAPMSDLDTTPSATPYDDKFRNLDFIHPLFVNFEGGMRTLQIDFTPLAENDIVNLTVIGFFLD